MFWRKNTKLDVQEVKEGKHLQCAEEVSATKSFEILINRRGRYPVKMYHGWHAVILFKAEDKIYWGFPKAGFSKTYIKKLFSCDAYKFNLLTKKHGDFSLLKGERIVAKWFAENVKEQEAERGRVLSGKNKVSVTDSDNQLIFEGIYLFYNEEVEEVLKKDRVYRYRKEIPVAKYKYKLYFVDELKLEDVEVERVKV